MQASSCLTLKLVAMIGFVVISASCAVTTRSTEGTSETFKNTSEASTDLTLSTSPDTDRDDASQQKVKAFAAANLDRLREDMARGNGEHLTAFAYLLGISENSQAEFFAMTKDKFSELYRTEQVSADEMLAGLNTELSGHDGWKNRSVPVSINK